MSISCTEPIHVESYEGLTLSPSAFAERYGSYVEVDENRGGISPDNRSLASFGFSPCLPVLLQNTSEAGLLHVKSLPLYPQVAETAEQIAQEGPVQAQMIRSHVTFADHVQHMSHDFRSRQAEIMDTIVIDTNAGFDVVFEHRARLIRVHLSLEKKIFTFEAGF